MTSTPKTLPAKNIKFSSIINFYNNKIIEAGLIDKQQLDQFSKIWDSNCADIISLQSEYLDYETTHIQNFKKEYKSMQDINKTYTKALAKYNDALDKWNQKFYKALHKFILNDPNIRQFIIDHDIDLSHIPNPNLLLPLQLLQDKKLLLPEHIPLLANPLLNLNPQLPLNLKLKPKPNQPNLSRNPTLHLTKETTEKQTKNTSDKAIPNNLTDVNLTNIDGNDYLIDKNNKIYNPNTSEHIGNINCDEQGNIIMPMKVNLLNEN